MNKCGYWKIHFDMIICYLQNVYWQRISRHYLYLTTAFNVNWQWLGITLYRYLVISWYLIQFDSCSHNQVYLPQSCILRLHQTYPSPLSLCLLASVLSDRIRWFAMSCTLSRAPRSAKFLSALSLERCFFFLVVSFPSTTP